MACAKLSSWFAKNGLRIVCSQSLINQCLKLKGTERSSLLSIDVSPLISLGIEQREVWHNIFLTLHIVCNTCHATNAMQKRQFTASFQAKTLPVHNLPLSELLLLPPCCPYNRGTMMKLLAVGCCLLA